MPVMDVQTYEGLIAGRDALLAAGLPADHPAVANLTAQIEKSSGTATRAWLVRVEEVAASINAKIRRVRSKDDAEKSYDGGKLAYDLHALIETLKVIKRDYETIGDSPVAVKAAA
jgi:hypothetical protein